MGIARNSRPLTSSHCRPLEVLVPRMSLVYYNVPPPISMDHPELGKLFFKAHKCPGQEVSYAETMIDISGRESCIKLGLLLGIRI